MFHNKNVFNSEKKQSLYDIVCYVGVSITIDELRYVSSYLDRVSSLPKNEYDYIISFFRDQLLVCDNTINNIQYLLEIGGAEEDNYDNREELDYYQDKKILYEEIITKLNNIR